MKEACPPALSFCLLTMLGPASLKPAELFGPPGESFAIATVSSVRRFLSGSPAQAGKCRDPGVPSKADRTGPAT